MEHKFHDVLSSVDAKQGRSPLECNGSRFYPSLLRVFLELSPPWTGAFLEHSRRVI